MATHTLRSRRRIILTDLHLRMRHNALHCHFINSAHILSGMSDALSLKYILDLCTHCGTYRIV